MYYLITGTIGYPYTNTTARETLAELQEYVHKLSMTYQLGNTAPMLLVKKSSSSPQDWGDCQ